MFLLGALGLTVGAYEAHLNGKMSDAAAFWPAMEFHPKSSPEAVLPGQVAQVRFDLSNYGRSPALHLIQVSKVFFGDDAVLRGKAWLLQAKSELKAAEQSGKTGVTADPVREGAKPEAAGTARSDETLTAQDVAKMRERDAQLVFVGRAAYQDRSGQTLASEACLITRKDGLFTACPRKEPKR